MSSGPLVRRPVTTYHAPMGYVLAFDFGERRIGVAVASLEVRVATGLPTVVWRSKGDLKEQLDRLIKEYEPIRLVVGDPLPMNKGSAASPLSREANSPSSRDRFLQKLRGWYGLPITCWDERLTSAQGERVLRQAGVSERRARARGSTDRMAAVLLLQNWLDSGEERSG